MATQSQLEQPLVEKMMNEIGAKVPYMDPGTIFLLDNSDTFGDSKNPFIAVLSCPRCGENGFITRRQLLYRNHMICGSDDCSAEYHVDGEAIVFRKPQ
jgi:formylmethanofuran dehydrogenase subunit E